MRFALWLSALIALISYGPWSQVIRVPLHLGALRRLVTATSLNRVVKGRNGMVVTARGVTWAPDGIKVTYSTDMPSSGGPGGAWPNGMLVDSTGHQFMANGEGGMCTTASPASKKMHCESEIIVGGTSGKGLALRVSVDVSSPHGPISLSTATIPLPARPAHPS